MMADMLSAITVRQLAGDMCLLAAAALALTDLVAIPLLGENPERPAIAGMTLTTTGMLVGLTGAAAIAPACLGRRIAIRAGSRPWTCYRNPCSATLISSALSPTAFRLPVADDTRFRTAVLLAVSPPGTTVSQRSLKEPDDLVIEDAMEYRAAKAGCLDAETRC